MEKAKPVNLDLKVFAMEHGVRLWKVARFLDISEPTMFRKLRKPFTPEEQERFKNAVLAIASGTPDIQDSQDGNTGKEVASNDAD